MLATRKPLDSMAMMLMIMLCACWGLQQVVTKATAFALHPVMQNGLRCLIAAVLLWMTMLWRGETFSLRDGRLLPGLGSGALFAGEFLLIAIGLMHTTASHMVVFLYTAPIFTAIGLHWRVAAERLGARQWFGVLLAFSGMALAFSAGFLGAHPSSDMLIGDSLGILAGIFWAATIVLVRESSLADAPPTQTLLYQLVVASIMLLGMGALMGQWSTITMNRLAWESLLFQALIVSLASYLTWFWLLRRYMASRLSAFSFLTPLFGCSFGVLLMHDPVSPRFVFGAALVFSGIVLVNWKRK